MSFFDLFKGDNGKEDSVTARTPLNLQVGDILEYDLVDYQVIGKVTYKQEGYVWYDYHLSAGEDNLWLFAEDDDQLKLVIFEKLPFKEDLYSKIGSKPPDKISRGEKEFSLVETGQAEITVEGQVGAKTGQRVRYADYVSGQQWLSVEWWGAELEISQGKEISESLLDYYPG